MLYDWPLNRRVVPRLVWASSTGANKPTLERLRRPRPQRVNWLVSSTTCLKTSSPTKNLTRPAINYDSKNPPSVNSKGRPLLWAIHCFQPPRFPPDSPVHTFKFLRSTDKYHSWLSMFSLLSSPPCVAGTLHHPAF